MILKRLVDKLPLALLDGEFAPGDRMLSTPPKGNSCSRGRWSNPLRPRSLSPPASETCAPRGSPWRPHGG
ncbi:MAG: hypothetical protein M3N16_01425 [Actinomycetota bacterium]|nr:hypothetical protein [Actinomycetota bacterium]